MDLEKQLLQYAIRLLARRNYPTDEIHKKLKLRAEKIHTRTDETVHTDIIENSIERVIGRLIQLNYLNDAFFAKNYLEAELRRKPQSLRLIKNKLQQKGIFSDVINQTIVAHQEQNLQNQSDPETPEEITLAKLALQKKIKTLKYSNKKQQKEKLFRFLAARGFSTGTILKVLN